jgi:alkanesulfonate monooxygenase SsuD/methylene tetrahydromethanopterin reductase-like flavin-dependent oxidoreductase (luciferase family)
MDVGVHYANFSHPGGAGALAPRLAETARVADEGGAEWFTVMDHWFQMETLGGPQEPMMEGYTTLGYLAAVTERVRLSLLVTGVTYRHPGLLAKVVSTLDVLSGGRAMLGIGAAWYEREHAGLGVPFPPLRSASSGSRRPSRSVGSCGAARSRIRAGTPAPTTSSPRPCACRRRCSRDRRS